MAGPGLLGELFPDPEERQFPDSLMPWQAPAPGYTGRVYDPRMYIDRDRETRGPLPLPFQERHQLEEAPETRTIHPRLERESPIRFEPVSRTEEEPFPGLELGNLPGFQGRETETTPTGEVRVRPPDEVWTQDDTNNLLDTLSRLPPIDSIRTIREPNGVIRIDPSVELPGDMRSIAEAYLNYPPPELARTPPPEAPEGERRPSRTYYQLLGEAIETPEGVRVRTPDGSVIPLPPRWAWNPETREVYRETPSALEGFQFQGGPRDTIRALPWGITEMLSGLLPVARDPESVTRPNVIATPRAIQDILDLIPRREERARLGLEVPPAQNNEEAFLVAGLATTGSLGLSRRVVREGVTPDTPPSGRPPPLREAPPAPRELPPPGDTPPARVPPEEPPVRPPDTTRHITDADARDIVRRLSDDTVVRRELSSAGVAIEDIDDLLHYSRTLGLRSALDSFEAGARSMRAVERRLGLTPEDSRYDRIVRAIEGLTNQPISRVIEAVERRTIEREGVPTVTLGMGGGSRPRGRRELPRPAPEDIDPAGFYPHSLRVARNLPESGTAESMRNRLLRGGVNEMEIRGLGLDDLFIGPRARHRRDLEEHYASHSRLAREYGEALINSRKHPDNPVYRDRTENLRRRLASSGNRLETLGISSRIAEREHIQGAVTRFREAERQVKLAYQAVRDASRRGSNYSRENALRDRADALKELKIAREALQEAPRQNPFSSRTITSKEIVEHIQRNRPVLGTFSRRVPTLEDQMTPGQFRGYKTIMDTNVLERELEDIGIHRINARQITDTVRGIGPANWDMAFSINPNINSRILGTLSRLMDGANIPDLALRLRQNQSLINVPNPQGGYTVRPRYSFSVPDQNNPTMVEQAVTMTHPGGGGPTPRMESTHWPSRLNVVGHMQTTIQRAPTPRSPQESRIITRLKNRFNELVKRRGVIENRTGMSQLESAASSREWTRVTEEMTSIRDRLSRLGPTKSTDDMIYMGNQFQSDAPRGGHHLTGHDPRSWLRPVLEQFVDQGIKSGARYIGIPTGKTVGTWNTIGDRTRRFYDETIRRELNYVLRRLGVKPVSRRTIDTMFDHAGDRHFSGEWHLIELPRGLPSGRGVRLYSNPDDPTAGLVGLTISNISRGPGYDPQLMNRRVKEGQSLVRRIRRTQATPTEVRNYPRAERVEMLERDDPHPGPVIGHHATDADFSTFDLSLSRDIGHHFGTRQQANNRVAIKSSEGGRVIPAYLNIRDPITLPDLGSWHPLEVASHIRNVVRAGGDPRRIEIAERLYDNLTHSTGTANRGDRVIAIRDALSDMGYDSVRYWNIVEGSGWSYIIWRPGLVRSVTDPTHQLYSTGIPLPTGGQGGQDIREDQQGNRGRRLPVRN